MKEKKFTIDKSYVEEKIADIVKGQGSEQVHTLTKHSGAIFLPWRLSPFNSLHN